MSPRSPRARWWARLAGDRGRDRQALPERERIPLERSVKQHLEDQFIRRGDDGLLEYLRDHAETDGGTEGLYDLVDAVLNRRLFKRIGLAAGAFERGMAGTLHDRFGTREARRDLEQRAAHFAGLAGDWQLVLWLPAPKMRLKVAEVLVDTDGLITPLDKVGNERAQEIYNAHRNLWAISIYAHPNVAADPATVQVIRAFLSEELGVPFPTGTEQVPKSITPTIAAALDHLVRVGGLPEVRRRAAVERIADFAVAAHGGEGSPTFVDLSERLRIWALAGD